ncbi:hypothetical protein GCM10022226_13390 [Sphaerisporangium flaviroseum]|uniref:Uncharacterized protein n=1 Tax=Sphaerisporangium flaviroseum TaxID=509199 RepID=A0ABP7HJM1_9ACTN
MIEEQGPVDVHAKTGLWLRRRPAAASRWVEADGVIRWGSSHGVVHPKVCVPSACLSACYCVPFGVIKEQVMTMITVPLASPENGRSWPAGRAAQQVGGVVRGSWLLTSEGSLVRTQ